MTSLDFPAASRVPSRAATRCVSAIFTGCGLALALSFASTVALAADSTSAPQPAPGSTSSAASTTPPDPALGGATRALLSLQTSGAAAAPAAPLPGSEATLQYRRYLDSFKHPIPEFFGSSVSKGGTGAGAGSGSTGSQGN